MTYTYKTDPFKHQDELFLATRNLEAYGVFWEMGCGKTKPIIDTAGYLWAEGKIDGLLVIAPNGVHRNWTNDEIPRHLSDEVPRKAVCYHSKDAKKSEQIINLDLLMQVKREALAVLVMSYDSLLTDNGKRVAKTFLTKKRCLMVLDESARIKSPSAKRTKTIILAGKYAKYRRILTGTPVANSPFDIYSQIKFLFPDFWKDREIGSFLSFKHRYGIIVQIQHGNGRSFPQVVGFRNLDELHYMIRNITSRVVKEDVLDLPPKLYSKRYFFLSPAQNKAYQDLKNQYLTVLPNGEEVTALLAITRLLRLHQITSGYLPDELGEVHHLGDMNRLNALKDTVEDIPHQALIWARFQMDITLICEALAEMKLTFVRYDGTTSQADREKALDLFHSGEAQFFVGNPDAAGEGLTLVEAKTVVYYNNSFRLVSRLQSEDRAHRIGQVDPVQYIDIVASGTVDDKIAEALRKKVDVSNQITGDRLKEWI